MDIIELLGQVINLKNKIEMDDDDWVTANDCAVVLDLPKQF